MRQAVHIANGPLSGEGLYRGDDLLNIHAEKERVYITEL
jgi:hypothetical protein